jgi:hypothetical protein
MMLLLDPGKGPAVEIGGGVVWFMLFGFALGIRKSA